MARTCHEWLELVFPGQNLVEGRSFHSGARTKERAMMVLSPAVMVVCDGKRIKRVRERVSDHSIVWLRLFGGVLDGCMLLPEAINHLLWNSSLSFPEQKATSRSRKPPPPSPSSSVPSSLSLFSVFEIAFPQHVPKQLRQ